MSEDATLSWVIVLGYLLGSIPFGLVLTKLAGFGDIRRIGSGNIGATNVLRTGNKKLAAAVLVLDGVKGAVAVGLGAALGADTAYLAAGVAAVFGHLFPLWLRHDRKALIVIAILAFGLSSMLTQTATAWQFVGALVLLALTPLSWGGKGVATTFGVLVAALPLVGGLAMLTWLAAAFASRRSSVGAIAAMVTAPLYCLLLPLAINPTLQAFDWLRSAFALFLALVVLLRHRDNILRLARGEEPRIQLGGQPKAS